MATLSTALATLEPTDEDDGNSDGSTDNDAVGEVCVDIGDGVNIEDGMKSVAVGVFAADWPPVVMVPVEGDSITDMDGDEVALECCVITVVVEKGLVVDAVESDPFVIRVMANVGLVLPESPKTGGHDQKRYQFICENHLRTMI